MFCNNCGNKIEENAKFCSKCGLPTANNTEYLNQTFGSKDHTVINHETPKNDSIDILISNLEIAIPIYQTLTKLNDELEQLKNDKSFYIKVFVSSYLIVTILVVLFLFLAGSLYVFFDSFAVLGLLLFGILIVLSSIVIYKNWKKIKNQREAEIKNAEEKIKNYFYTHECSALYCVPEKYRYYIAVSYIYECLKNGRAGNLKEAINLYEEQCHRWKMEASQQQLNAKIDQQARMINRIQTQQDMLTFINLMKKN